MTDKDFYMMGIHNALYILLFTFEKSGLLAMLELLTMNRKTFNKMVAEEFDTRRKKYIEDYQKRVAEAATSGPTQPEGNA